MIAPTLGPLLMLLYACVCVLLPVCVQDIAALLSRGASEAHREVAALKQQQMALKLEAGRLTR